MDKEKLLKEVLEDIKYNAQRQKEEMEKKDFTEEQKEVMRLAIKNTSIGIHALVQIKLKQRNKR